MGKLSRGSQGSPGTAHGLSCHSRQNVRAWRSGATNDFCSCRLASLLRLWLSVIRFSAASIPRLKYSFLYLWRSSHGILHKCAFLQKHGAIFLTSEIPKGQKVNIIPVWLEWLFCDISSHLSSLLPSAQSNRRSILKPIALGLATCFSLSAEFQSNMISGVNASTMWNAKFGLWLQWLLPKYLRVSKSSGA